MTARPKGGISLDNELLRIGPLTVSVYGLMIGLGFAAALIVGAARAKTKDLSRDTVHAIAMVAIIGGIVGAKLLFYITEWKAILENPRLMLDITRGFVVYGGIVGGILAAWIYCRVRKLPFLKYFDLLAPSVAIAQAIGRIGCVFAGCCYGRPTDLWFGVPAPYAPDIHVIPTQLISSAGDFIIAAILLLMARKRQPDGRIAAGYMILYGAGRFLLEFLRDDPRGAVGALSTSQFISIFIVATGIAIILLPYWKYRKPSLNP